MLRTAYHELNRGAARAIHEEQAPAAIILGDRHTRCRQGIAPLSTSYYYAIADSRELTYHASFVEGASSMARRKAD